MNLAAADIANILAEDKAEFVETLDGVAVPRGFAVRFWRRILQEDLDECVKFLKVYTSAKNYPTAGGAVVDPVIKGRNNRSGTWKNVSVRLAYNREGELCLFQTLRERSACAIFTFAADRSALTDADATVYMHYDTKVDALASNPGYVYSASNSLNEEDGSYNARLDYQKAKLSEVTFDSRRTAFSASRRTVHTNRETPVNAAAPATGSYSASNSVNRFGYYDGALEYDYPVGNGAVVGWTSARSQFSEEYEYQYRKRPSVLQAPDRNVGEALTASNSLTDEGVYESRLNRRTGNADDEQLQTEAWTDGSALYRRTMRNQTAPPAVQANEPRLIYDDRFSKNDLGRYDGVREIHKPAKLETGPFVSMRTDTAEEYTYQYDNQDIYRDVPLGERGRTGWNRNPRDNTWNGQIVLHRDRTGATWWGESSGETKFHYVNSDGNDIYVYDKFTTGLSAAETWVAAEAAVAGATVIGQDSGHFTDIQPFGRGRLRGRRVEKL